MGDSERQYADIHLEPSISSSVREGTRTIGTALTQQRFFVDDNEGSSTVISFTWADTQVYSADTAKSTLTVATNTTMLSAGTVFWKGHQFITSNSKCRARASRPRTFDRRKSWSRFGGRARSRSDRCHRSLGSDLASSPGKGVSR
ncbi:hypothetical protein DOTSEDRAFT_32310 [Dothistroma septosporum NZE10]|uniref:Uncharacterized protein n=1 Tax=Dothistroma septosporum (strain NZE10 / CBS 128990) TaxID=675120 RepID=N1PWP7_DOTSN|nr:hypothetical protein DOTSEDRAFT_32310 [Dothistroma septosporum NZE10]